jgi:hypothetical protein
VERLAFGPGKSLLGQAADSAAYALG